MPTPASDHRPATAPAASLVACASVVIPALNQQAHIGQLVRAALADPATAEVLVVDAGSVDETTHRAKEAGAEVISASMLGKGAAMRDALAATQCALIVYLSAEGSQPPPGLISRLCQPLMTDEADLTQAGRSDADELSGMAAIPPLLSLYFPELARFARPWAGDIAARRTLLAPLRFEDAVGVDIGLLIDAAMAGARMMQVDLGPSQRQAQPVTNAAAAANEVARIVYARARGTGRLHGDQVAAMYEAQRQATATIEHMLARRGARSRLLLLDLDVLLAGERFEAALARVSGLRTTLDGLLGSTSDGQEVAQRNRLAGIFRRVPHQRFVQVAQGLPIRPGAARFVQRMRRAGFMVGVVGDSYFVAAEIIRRRLFADFAIAHTLQFDGEVCNGELRLNPAFLPAGAEPPVPRGMGQVIRRFRADCVAAGADADAIWAVGTGLQGLALPGLAERVFDFAPGADAHAFGLTRVHGFDSLVALSPQALRDGAEQA